jgi:hypothetical protein
MINFVKECQKLKQPYQDFMAQFKAQGDEANLAAITPDDLYVLWMIAGAYDDELHTKFLREGNPTLGKEAVGTNTIQEKTENQG